MTPDTAIVPYKTGLKRVIWLILTLNCVFLMNVAVWVLINTWGDLTIVHRAYLLLLFPLFAYGIARDYLTYVLFDRDGIEHSNWFGKQTHYAYDDVDRFGPLRMGLQMEMRNGKTITINRYEGDMDRIADILNHKCKNLRGRSYMYGTGRS